MEISRWAQQIDLSDRRNLYIALSAPIIGLASLRLLSSFNSPSKTPKAQTEPTIFRSPLHSLSSLSTQEQNDLPYPPDALPGARDVDSPYGNIRVYEWGPEDGRKVLFVHGISTPCIAFAGMAKLLVEKGCRVMLFDLFGRGYSDAPDPDLYPQDIRLFTTQIMLVLESSQLAWTGTDNAFTLVGYSLGGGIAASFTSYFPRLVSSLVLLAPGGLIRPHHISATSKILYNGWLPKAVINTLVAKRLRASNTGQHPAGGKTSVGSGETPAAPRAGEPNAVAESELPDHPALAKNSSAAVFEDRPRIAISDVVTWQTDSHPGFVESFISSIKFAPITNSHERWGIIGRRQEAQRKGSKADGLKEGKALILLGKQDGVIIADEVEVDATKAMGADNVKIVKLEGGHDVPIVNATGCVDAMFDFWGESSS